MKSFKRYFAYRLKDARIYFIIMTVLLSIISISNDIGLMKVDGVTTGIYAPISDLAFFYAVLTFVVPIFEFSGFMNRRNADTVCFFPIDRWHTVAAHYLTSLITVISSMVVSFGVFYARLLIFINNEEALRGVISFGDSVCYVEAILAAIVLAAANITITSFLFCRANTLFDGCLCSAMWTFVPLIVLGAVESVIASSDVYTQEAGKLLRMIDGEYLLPGWNIIPTMTASSISWSFGSTFKNVFVQKSVLIPCGLIIILAILALVGMIVLSGRRKTEKIEDISDSWFAYKLLIPIYAFSIAILIGGNTYSILTVVLAIAMLVGYSIFRRSLKLHKSDIIVMVTAILVSLFEIKL